MGLTITEKIIKAHKVAGTLDRGGEVALKIDQTLTQDATGTMCYLQFETMDVARVRTEVSVSYIDHNTIQEDYKNADDHRYLQSAAARYGLYFSQAGNGICHQVHLENFGVPGETLLGSDSHTPTCGGLGMLAMGAGGLDVAVAMAGGAFTLTMPRIYCVRLTGALRPAASAKDIILELLRRETVKGGVGAVYEYQGTGVASLSVMQRATITNMGAELGATSSVFPSDENTRAFLTERGRADTWRGLKADDDAVYDKIIDIDLGSIEPLAACPHSPDNVKPVASLLGTPVDQVVIGSCTNSSIEDLAAAAEILKGKTVHPRVSAGLACGSRAILLAANKSGILQEFLRAGFRVLENVCGPCIGMGFAPVSNAVSLRTFNRNFKGRSGTASAGVYLVSVETAAASAVSGTITPAPVVAASANTTGSGYFADITQFANNMLLPPLPQAEAVKVRIEHGPNIKPVPAGAPLPDALKIPVLIKTGDNITTDDIMPAGAKALPFRSNIPEISKFVFNAVDSGFYDRAQKAVSGLIVGGTNYGQGSSREHAALAPMFLGVKVVLAVSFARIHKANLINYGILPLVFADSAFYNKVEQNDLLEFSNLHQILSDTGGDSIKFTAQNITKKEDIVVVLEVSEREKQILLSGGTILWTKKNA
ncbi:aconitate hydratase [Spirochaetia bacterium]|nr:aconitate hydratase [Spirochaetia bacterium]